MSKPVQILLVEDNASDILLVRLALAGVPIRVHLAVDVEQAIRILTGSSFKPSLVILDLNLPKLSGLSVLERWQPDVPVVVFTSCSSSQDRQRSLELGAKEYLQKPTDVGEFTRVVSQIVRNWASPASNAASTS